MRLVYVAHYAGGTDAASAMDADLFAALREQGHEVVVLSPFRDPEAGRIGGSVAAGRLPRLLLALRGYLRVVREALRSVRGDARIASQYHAFHPATATAFLVARLRGRPLLARAHDPLPGSYRSGIEASANRAAFRAYRGILNHRQTVVTVPSPELRELAGSRLGLSSVRVLPNNVTALPEPDPGAVRGLRTSLGLDGARVVLQFGSFTRTGAATFVEAIRLLPEGIVGVVLADPSRGAEFLREAAARGVSHRVRVLGLRPRAELGAFVALADVCVGLLSADPAAVGSLPRNTLESMAAGKPVVLCAGVVSADLVEDGRNALLVPPDDPRAVADAVARILGDPDLAGSLKRHARETIRARFDSAAVARAFASLLDALPPPEALKGRAEVAAA